MIKELDIRDAKQAENISRLAASKPYEVWLSTPTAMLDARSLMGIISLVGQRVHVVVEDDTNVKDFSRLVDKMSK